MEKKYDALIVGAGVGGLCAAARLSTAGYKVLVVESLPRIGGRASTREVDGFLVNTGGFAIERDGAVAKTCEDLNLPLDLYVPKVETTMLWGNRQISLDTGLVSVLRNVLPFCLNSVMKVLPRLRPRKNEVVGEWLGRFTSNKKVHQVIENLNCSIFAATNSELPADVFLYYFSKSTAFKKTGFGPGGTISVWQPMAELIKKMVKYG